MSAPGANEVQAMGVFFRSHAARAGALARPAQASGLVALVPALAAIAYPFLLQGFHAVVTAAGDEGPALKLLAAPLLLGAFAAPALGLWLALRSADLAPGSASLRRARQLALLSVASPPLFVFMAFLLSVLGHPLPETSAWVIVWLVAAWWVWAGRGAEGPQQSPPPGSGLRVAHGGVAVVLVVYVGFHLANHLFGLIGPAAHAAVMTLGRKVYRAPAVEAALVGLLLLQVALGGRLAWQWSLQSMDRYRVFQVASGVYLWFFILTHMNSALVSARALRGIDTGWDWASGAPTGLIHDAWSIRLVPHYALGVFFVLAHLASGLRVVLVAHGAGPAAAHRAWVAGLAGAAAVSVAILAGLCGVRIS